MFDEDDQMTNESFEELLCSYTDIDSKGQLIIKVKEFKEEYLYKRDQDQEF